MIISATMQRSTGHHFPPSLVSSTAGAFWQDSYGKAYGFIRASDEELGYVQAKSSGLLPRCERFNCLGTCGEGTKGSGR